MNSQSVPASAVFPGDGYIAGFNGIRAIAVGMVAMHLALYTNPQLLPLAITDPSSEALTGCIGTEV